MKGEPTVLVGKLPAARMGDNGQHAACCGPNAYVIMKGSATVLIGKMPAARIGDDLLHCGCFPGKIMKGEPTVLIGG